MGSVEESFELYREALVVETGTIWSDEPAEINPAHRQRIAERLRADAVKAGAL